jgi:hypothetical protein
MNKIAFILVIASSLLLSSCTNRVPTSDEIQQRQQEDILKEVTAGTGMPNIKNGRERRLLKEILELRDQDGLATYTYLYSELTGKKTFLCNSIGYGIPYATQYTNPQKIEYHQNLGYTTLPQADPNGLFSPGSAEGTWVMCLDGARGKAVPLYVEPRIITSPFKLDI